MFIIYSIFATCFTLLCQFKSRLSSVIDSKKSFDAKLFMFLTLFEIELWNELSSYRWSDIPTGNKVYLDHSFVISFELETILPLKFN